MSFYWAVSEDSKKGSANERKENESFTQSWDKKMLLVPGTAQVLIRHFCYVNIYVKKLCILQHRLVPDSFYGNNLKI